MLRPIRDAIVALEADDTTLGTAYHYWLVIAAHLQRHVDDKTTSPELRKHVIKWTNYYWGKLPHDLMATALLIHPHLRDAVPLTVKTKKGACMFVYNYVMQIRQDSPDCKKIANTAAAVMREYIAREERFARLKPAQGQSDIDWWRRWVVDGSPVGDAMVEVVERVHSIPPHTATVERFFSRLGFMQRPRRNKPSVKMLVRMAKVHAWLVKTDEEQSSKPSRAASKRVEAARASDGGQEGAATDSKSDDSDGEEDEDEDRPADADTDDAAETATDGNSESLVRTEGTSVAPEVPGRPIKKKRPTAHAAESTSLLAMEFCDLKSPFLLAGIRGSGVAQEAPAEEAPQASSAGDDEFGDVETQEMLDRLFPDD
jgi:hypothetical protein